MLTVLTLLRQNPYSLLHTFFHETLLLHTTGLCKEAGRRFRGKSVLDAPLALVPRAIGLAAAPLVSPASIPGPHWLAQRCFYGSLSSMLLGSGDDSKPLGLI